MSAVDNISEAQMGNHINVTPATGDIQAPGQTGSYISGSHPVAKSLNRIRTVRNFADMAKGTHSSSDIMHAASDLAQSGGGSQQRLVDTA